MTCQNFALFQIGQGIYVFQEHNIIIAPQFGSKEDRHDGFIQRTAFTRITKI